ncbi:hypothetical protein Hanom_Chr09g00790921 [Helianthus anomalus]
MRNSVYFVFFWVCWVLFFVSLYVMSFIFIIKLLIFITFAIHTYYHKTRR